VSSRNTSADPPSPLGAGAAAWAPFRHKVFLIIWVATVVSNIGTWMYNLASGWLMMGLDADPFIVSMVQVANTLPLFLFAIPAGALVDVVDRRRFLIFGESAITIMSVAFAALVWLHLITPVSLLFFSFIVSVGSAMTAPAWQAVVPQLVPRPDLQPAISANSAGINVSRAIGPALGGVLIGSAGIAAPFWLDAFSNIGVIAALIWWRPRKSALQPLPPESFWGAMRTGIRHARYNSHLRATLIRAITFFAFAGAYWALLPLIVRVRIVAGPGLYGVLLGIIGASAVISALVLPRLRSRWSADQLLIGATVATSLATALFGIARNPLTAVAASILAGASWVVALTGLSVSAQVALPEWVRGRGLAMYVTVMFGALSVGSAIWGGIATRLGLPASLLIAAAGAVASIPLTRRWTVQTGADVDLSPSMHWPAPVTTHPIEGDRGPVLVTVEYSIDPSNREPFLRALGHYGRERRRDGAYSWGVYEDLAHAGRFIETFLTDSWLEHLRLHERVTKADRKLEDSVRRFQVGEGPKTTHLVDAQPRIT
jgi:predicted MFS family arabinose efflux permease